MPAAGGLSAEKKAVLKKSFKVASRLEVFYTGGDVAVPSSDAFAVCPCGDQVKVVDLATARVLQTLPGDTEPITSVAVSPDGRQVFTSSRSLQTKWWVLPPLAPSAAALLTSNAVPSAAASGGGGGSTLVDADACKRTWKAHDAPVITMAVHCSGALLATGSTDRSVRVWDVEKGFCTHSFRGHEGMVTTVIFHPDASRLQLFSGNDGAVVRVWDLNTKRCTATLKSHFSAVTGLSVSEDGATLVSCGRDKVANVWDLTTHKLLRTVPVYEALEAVHVIPSSSSLPGAASAGAQDKPKKKSKSLPGAVAKGQASGELHFVTAGEKGILRVWNASTGECVYEASSMAAHKFQAGGLVGAQVVNGGEALLAVTADQRLLLMRPSTDAGDQAAGEVAGSKRTSPSPQPGLVVGTQLVGNNEDIIDACFVGQDNSLLAVATNSEQLLVYDTASLSCSASLRGHTDIIVCVDACPMPPAGRQLLVTGAKDNTARVWDVSDGSCLGMAVGHTGAVGAVTWPRRSSEWFVTGSSDRTIKVWNAATLPPPRSGAAGSSEEEDRARAATHFKARAVVAAHDKDINALAVAPNDAILCSGSQDRTAKLWRLPDLTPMMTLRGHKRGIWSVAFSPVDKCVATSSGDATVKMWSLADGSCLRTFEGHTASVLKCRFVTLGTQLVSVGADGLLKLWMVKSSECINTFDAHEDRVWALAVSADEGTLVTGGGDSLLNIWRDATQEEEEEAIAEQHAKVLKEQDMANALADGDFASAVALAFELKRPMQLYKVFTEMSLLDKVANAPGSQPPGTQPRDSIAACIARMTLEQLETCLTYAREWNTNVKYSNTAQLVLQAVLRTHPPRTLVKIPNLKDLLEGIVPYTQRHFARVDRLVRGLFSQWRV
eukprot:jgi/Mesvir1/8693/Mv02630-RA.2